MKPNIKSLHFKLALLSLLAYIINLFILSAQVRENILNASIGEKLPSIYFFLPFLWISLAGLLFFKSTKIKQSITNQILALILTPIILSPILAIFYVIMVLLPIYNIAGSSL